MMRSGLMIRGRGGLSLHCVWRGAWSASLIELLQVQIDLGARWATTGMARLEQCESEYNVSLSLGPWGSGEMGGRRLQRRWTTRLKKHWPWILFAKTFWHSSGISCSRWQTSPVWGNPIFGRCSPVDLGGVPTHGNPILFNWEHLPDRFSIQGMQCPLGEKWPSPLRSVPLSTDAGTLLLSAWWWRTWCCTVHPGDDCLTCNSWEEHL